MKHTSRILLLSLVALVLCSCSKEEQGYSPTEQYGEDVFRIFNDSHKPIIIRTQADSYTLDNGKYADIQGSLWVWQSPNSILAHHQDSVKIIYDYTKIVTHKKIVIGDSVIYQPPLNNVFNPESYLFTTDPVTGLYVIHYTLTEYDNVFNK